MIKDDLHSLIVDRVDAHLATNFRRGKLGDPVFRSVVSHNLVNFVINDIAMEYDLTRKKHALRNDVPVNVTDLPDSSKWLKKKARQRS